MGYVQSVSYQNNFFARLIVYNNFLQLFVLATDYRSILKIFHLQVTSNIYFRLGSILGVQVGHMAVLSFLITAFKGATTKIPKFLKSSTFFI